MNEENATNKLSNIGKKSIGHIIHGNRGKINSYIDCDLRTINNYTIIINTASALNSLGIGPGESYDRHILGSLFLNGVTELNNCRGYIQNIVTKKNVVRIYIGNVFNDDIYLSNHLVVFIKDEVFKTLDVKAGDFIEFSGKISPYKAANKATKFGLTDVEINNVLSNNYEDCVDKINQLIEDESLHYDFEGYGVPLNGYYYYMVYLISRIHERISLKKETKIPINYFINMILSLHFPSSIERCMLMNQGDTRYLKDNSKYLCLPLSTILFALEELNIYDPFTILELLINVYSCCMSHEISIIEKINNARNGVINEEYNRYLNFFKTKKKFIDFNGLQNTLIDYSMHILSEYNNLISE